MHRQPVVHREEIEHPHAVRDKRQIALDVVRHFGEQGAVDGERNDIAVAERVAVGRGSHDIQGADGERSAGLILDHESHAHLRAQLLRKDAHQDVRRAARRRRNDEADRFFGIPRRCACAAGEKQQGE